MFRSGVNAGIFRRTRHPDRGKLKRRANIQRLNRAGPEPLETATPRVWIINIFTCSFIYDYTVIRD
jgi:hypothetical protein